MIQGLILLIPTLQKNVTEGVKNQNVEFSLKKLHFLRISHLAANSNFVAFAMNKKIEKNRLFLSIFFPFVYIKTKF